MSNWYLENGKESDVVISTRVRLARNFKDFNFESKCSKMDKNKIIEYIEKVVPYLGFDLNLLRLKDMDDLTKISLIEKNIISPELVNNGNEDAGILINQEENICVMINEEDHVRLQVFSEGLALEEMLNLIIEIDKKIEQNIEYAYNEKYGYLTACPTNVGTGCRVSVMLHLPGLSYTGNLNKIFGIVNKLGINVRGVYGEGTQSIGNLYQISNSQTLGISEEEIVKNMRMIVEKIIEQERLARKYLIKNNNEFEDKVYRAWGILTNARLISNDECIELLSSVKLGIDMGVIEEIDEKKIKKMFLYTKIANLQKYCGKIMDAKDRDYERAKLIKNIINE